ncbi:hypothetical protein [Bacillus changyiensis]
MTSIENKRYTPSLTLAFEIGVGVDITEVFQYVQEILERKRFYHGKRD